ncbi:hypothetical protein C7444_101346 [Sphaerotilus hippei]|uniref:SET domain-containing protein n=1 Tax=Sphaerotilus hippei TaxID=744406 RepID=A0A318H601_9BURK|nr:SET domain-containing protein-lysine N-methyltransferase [Sphaerotilus hippei]PXW99516.1 hypothetical protein C7444_101346 [Sphaerotilus hippei]
MSTTRRQRPAPNAGLDADSALAAPPPATGQRRIQVRRSGVHGRGVFAVLPLQHGERIIEYKGEIIDWDEALRRHPHDPSDPNHTFYFHLDDGHVIDGAHQGNSSRWINHACAPNCEAEEIDGRIFICALRDIDAGEELFFDYRLVIDERYTAKLKKAYACRCGAATCRGTMLAPKR